MHMPSMRAGGVGGGAGTTGMGGSGRDAVPLMRAMWFIKVTILKEFIDKDKNEVVLHPPRLAPRVPALALSCACSGVVLAVCTRCLIAWRKDCTRCLIAWC
jgi:hypothetical protein